MGRPGDLPPLVRPHLPPRAAQSLPSRRRRTSLLPHRRRRRPHGRVDGVEGHVPRVDRRRESLARGGVRPRLQVGRPTERTDALPPPPLVVRYQGHGLLEAGDARRGGFFGPDDPAAEADGSGALVGDDIGRRRRRRRLGGSGRPVCPFDRRRRRGTGNMHRTLPVFHPIPHLRRRRCRRPFIERRYRRDHRRSGRPPDDSEREGGDGVRHGGKEEG
mmetsp:Transcript_54756/g.163752  ORF Transcript_54756/g.163752 Transcript_54756/m.163752 type:complete len:217 (+) Transcript_54756:2337-2987(+)